MRGKRGNLVPVNAAFFCSKCIEIPVFYRYDTNLFTKYYVYSAAHTLATKAVYTKAVDICAC